MGRPHCPARLMVNNYEQLIISSTPTLVQREMQINIALITVTVPALTPSARSHRYHHMDHQTSPTV